MKKVILVVGLVMMILIGCNTGPSNKICEDAKFQLEVGGDISLSDGTSMNYILNTNHPPDSVGAILRECIENDWDWR